MTTNDLIPVADAIPVDWRWLYFFLVLTFVLHLLFMNAMLGSAIMAFVSELREKNAGPSKDISTKLPYTIAFTVNLGVASPALFAGFIRPFHLCQFGTHGRVLAGGDRPDPHALLQRLYL